MPDEIVPFLPEEAYHLTERARLMSDAATEGMDEYGLGGLAYAKARDFATKANQARAWQDQNTPEIIPEDSTPIPDVDREIETRPEIADGKNYNDLRITDDSPGREDPHGDRTSREKERREGF